uniref:Secreted RxLR effector protein 38 n=1 Tax=Plasmopara viticola TaxID=143451 RepID=RLR38_PLAVT|nr:RecName: Full=Secreted RxLR effector protein 38; Flags: Precursor [Plasmopara viticola]
MHLIYIVMAATATTLHASSSAILDPSDVKIMTKNVESRIGNDAAFAAGRFLRGAYEDVHREEERMFGLKQNQHSFIKPSQAQDAAAIDALNIAKEALESTRNTKDHPHATATAGDQSLNPLIAAYPLRASPNAGVPQQHLGVALGSVHPHTSRST